MSEGGVSFIAREGKESSNQSKIFAKCQKSKPKGTPINEGMRLLGFEENGKLG
jgi:hypothetical protein